MNILINYLFAHTNITEKQFRIKKKLVTTVS